MNNTSLRRSRRARLLVVAILVGVPVAGCGGGSHTPSAGSPGAAEAPATVTALASGAAPSAPVPSAATLYCEASPCYTPRQFLAAYGIQPLLDRGIDGRGETVTVLVPATRAHEEASDLRLDLESFDSTFRLPPARIEVVTSLAGSDSPWRASLEEVNDTEIVHAVAPAATLRVVLMPANIMQSVANATADVLAGLRLATEGADVASISLSLGEHYFTRAQVTAMHSTLLAAAARHVTVVASSGNEGWFSVLRFGSTRVKEVSLPASDPLVLAAGGTRLTVNRSTGAYAGETGWYGGGGFSHLFARPAYQDGVPGISNTRGVPDVAADAEEGGLARVVAVAGMASLTAAGGTSDSAPLWGGIVALADQYARHDLGSVNPAIYRIGRSSSYHSAFHDVTTGSNGYPAGPGWDPVTGWGSPNAQVLVPLLAGSAGSSSRG